MPSSIKTLFIKTHGCQMNEYDSDKMVQLLKNSHGLELVAQEDKADVLLINTCSIREKASEKVFSQLGRWRKIKNKKPNLIICVGGCVASQEGDVILKRAPYVDVVFGPQTLHRLPNMINDVLINNKSHIDISFPEVEKFDNLPEVGIKGPKAIVSIMEGCSKYCTFCVVPYTRGEEISRPFDDVIIEVANLAEKGAKEITLLGQNVNAYRGKMSATETADLALLIATIAEIDGVERIKYMTSHPMEFSDNLIEAYAEVPKLTNYLHLPVQSGSDRILNLMKRGHTILEYKSKIRRLREIRPNLSISSDFIIGFPGETQADFQKTIDLIENIHFDNSFSFIYSKRPGTPASNYPDDVTLETKKQRLNIVQDRLKQQCFDISRKMVGSTEQVLVTHKSSKFSNQFCGTTFNNKVVNIDLNQENDNKLNLIGKIVDIKVTDALANSLKGILV
tara:strand:+ start:32838 stop:34187 length:1350 start_codon:yes stop_codon:yes gene_type:complete